MVMVLPNRSSLRSRSGRRMTSQQASTMAALIIVLSSELHGVPSRRTKSSDLTTGKYATVI